MTEPGALEIPIFPLNTVLFPGGLLPLRIFEARYVDMIKTCLRDASVFGVCQILEGKEVGKPALPAPIGCTARISRWDTPSPGLFKVMCVGERPFRVVDHWSQADGLIKARVECLPASEPQALPPRYAVLAEFLRDLLEKFGQRHFEPPAKFEDVAWVSHRLSEMLPFDPVDKLRMLETVAPAQKLALLEQLMRNLDH